jgi:hypothetical protein
MPYLSSGRLVRGFRNVMFTLAVEQYAINLNPTCTAG